jgi:Leucine-rich repeat (LRR) protein
MDLFGMLDLNGFIALEYLDIAGNYITYLDLSDCDSLIYLNAFNNILESLVVPTAVIIDASFNRLIEVDVNNADNLEELYLDSNGLTSINLFNNINLIKLDISNNNLLNLDLSANPNITNLRSEHNYLDVQAGSSLRLQIEAIEGRTGHWYVMSRRK